jgi:hypothetical protein
MASLTLVHPEETFKILALQAMTKCRLFQNNPPLLVSPYRVHSPVSLSIFREFLSALEGTAITLTDTNFRSLQRLSKEFGFSEFETQLSEFRPSVDFKESEDADARGRIASLEEKANQHNRDIEILQSYNHFFSVKFQHSDLQQREFKHFPKKFQRNLSNFEKKFQR